MEKVTEKEIIEDINKIKDIRREILRINFLDRIERDREGIKIIKVCKGLIISAGVWGGIILFLIDFIPAAIFAIAAFSLFAKLYNDFGKLIEKKLIIDTNLNKRNVSDIDELIDNYELILDNRKGKNIDESKIKNLNICFSLDKRYNYDLQKINDKYKYIVSDEVNTNDYVNFDKYFKDIKLSVNNLNDEMMPKSKVRIKSIYKE